MAFVEVHHVDLLTQSVEQPHAADAQQDLLAQAHAGVAAVEGAGDLAQIRGILRQVGVQQVQVHATHLQAPSSGLVLPVSIGNWDLDGGAVGAQDRRDWQP